MTGLILEGGGMRGAFTAGVLDSFLKNNIHFDSVYGVSAGASNGASYIARQQGRNRKVFVDRVEEFRYFSLKHVLTQGNLLDVRLLFDAYPNKLIPFDYESFENSRSKFFTVLTDCCEGVPVYIEKASVNRRDFMLKILAGSNSLPLLSPAVKIDGRPHLDGGLTDSIPLRKAVEDGCTKTVVILTREKGYRKEPSGLTPLIKTVYRKWPKITERFGKRHIEYNDSVDYCLKARKEGSCIIIQPESTMDVGRTERDVKKLSALYKHGFDSAEAAAAGIVSFIS